MTNRHRWFALLFDWKSLCLILPLFIYAEYQIFTHAFHNKLVLSDAIEQPYYFNRRELTEFVDVVLLDAEFFSEAWHPVRLAEVLEIRGLDAQAEALLTRTVERHPENHLLRYHQGLILMRMEQDTDHGYGAVKTIFQDLLSAADRDAPADSSREARSALSRNGSRLLGDKANPYPARSELLYLLGWIAFHENDYPLAIKHLERALLLGSAQDETVNLLAWNWIRVDEPSKAIELLMNRGAASPLSRTLSRTLVHGLFAAGDYPRGTEVFKDLVAAYPREEAYVETIVGIMTEKEAYPEATALIEGCLETNPESWLLRHLLAQVYHWAGHYEESAALYRELIKEQENDAQFN